MSAISTGYFPKLVPPNFCTTQRVGAATGRGPSSSFLAPNVAMELVLRLSDVQRDQIHMISNQRFPSRRSNYEDPPQASGKSVRSNMSAKIKVSRKLRKYTTTKSSSVLNRNALCG